MSTYEHGEHGDADNQQRIQPASRWTPILNGTIYCSPACGGRCKKADYDQAVTDAANLAAGLGDGWKPRVWENMGWHYSAVKDVAAVYAPNRGGYWVSIGGNTTGSAMPQFIGEAANPVEAVKIALEQISALIRIATAKRQIIAQGLGQPAPALPDLTPNPSEQQPE